MRLMKASLALAVLLTGVQAPVLASGTVHVTVKNCTRGDQSLALTFAGTSTSYVVPAADGKHCRASMEFDLPYGSLPAPIAATFTSHMTGNQVACSGTVDSGTGSVTISLDSPSSCSFRFRRR